MKDNSSEPLYIISVAAKMVGVHTQTLRYYEKMGLIKPARSQGQRRFYSLRDIERLRKVKSMINDLGVNLAGAEIILRLTEQLALLQKRLMEMEEEIKRLKGGI